MASVADRLEATLNTKKHIENDQGSESEGGSSESDPLEEAVYLFEEASRLIEDSSGTEGDIRKLLTCCIDVLTTSESSSGGGSVDGAGSGGGTTSSSKPAAAEKGRNSKKLKKGTPSPTTEEREEALMSQLPPPWRHVLAEALILLGRVVEWRDPVTSEAHFKVRAVPR
jgi:hypothetical protein